MKAKWATCAGFAACILATSFADEPANPARNDPSMAAYRTTVSEVRVTFFVTDANNHSVDLVDRSDFAVVDDDLVVREFRSVARAEKTALDLAVLIDASASISSSLPTIMGQVRQLVRHQQTTNDSTSVVAFAGLNPDLLCAQDCGSAEANNRLNALEPSGLTPLFDALAYSATLVSDRHQTGTRPVVILFSDGHDTISKTSAQEALRAVIGSGALLYAIDLNTAGSSSYGSGALQRMAEATGGRTFSLPESDQVLETVLEDLRTSYVVTYQLPGSRVGYHSLRILPKHNLNLRFHCRSGYYYGTSVP